MAPRATLLATTSTLLNAYPTLSPPNILSSFAPTASIHLLPSSLSTPIWPLTAYAAQVHKLCAMFASARLTPVSDPVVDEENCRVTVHLREEFVTVGGYEWESEAVFMLRMDEEGDKVVELREFCDSVKQREFFEAMGKEKAKAEQAKAEAEGSEGREG